MPTWINAGSYVDKFAKLFSDNKVLPSEWKFGIPLLLVQQPLPVVINAKNFADGIQYHIELHGVNIPPDLLVYDPYSNDYLLD